ncbi:MAG: helix-turn-helix domain-containing protein [Deltaproteobacteria bacterium]|nr:helix-turn-helix domain-containing protein [Deltaproteobacteria bacterium]
MPNIPTSEYERAEWIKYQLRLKGYTLARLGREIGVDRCTPGRALQRPYPKMERAIAEKLALHPKDLWPERYTPNGQPNRPLLIHRAATQMSTLKHDSGVGSNANVPRDE